MPRVIKLLFDKAAYSERDHAYAMQSISDNPTLNPQNGPTRNHPLAFEAASTVHAHITNRALSKPHPPSLNLTVRNGRGNRGWLPFCNSIDGGCCLVRGPLPMSPKIIYRVEQKNPAKFVDTCSVRADRLCIGCLGQQAERGWEIQTCRNFFARPRTWMWN